MLKRLLKQEWEAIAGILAAIAAIVLHFLHITEQSTLLAITLVLIALLFLRDLRRENQMEKISSVLEDNLKSLGEIKDRVTPSEISLIGPAELRTASEAFARKGQGEAVWFNVCLRMYKSQEPFNLMLKPFIDNPKIKTLRFVLNVTEKDRWVSDLLPKIKACAGYAKVEEPCWVNLDNRVSFIIVEKSEGKAEALISFWGEPFMAIGIDKSVPRYVIRVNENSDLIPRLKEIERITRLNCP
jgi:hypothetical protein